MTKLTIDGKCDLTRYPVSVAEGARITAVEYKDLTLPRIPNKKGGYYVPPHAQLTLIGDPPDLIPDSPIAAYWYTRACSEHKRQAMFYHYRPDNLLVVFPAVNNDGDHILITIEEPTPDERIDPRV